MSTELRQQQALSFAAGTVLNLMLGVALVFSAMLRETPIFWRNAGGFPVWLREAVLMLFYPALAIFTATGLAAIWLMFAWFVGTRLLKPAWAAVTLQWLLWLAVVLIALWNNLNNLLAGAPLHQHLP